jgi:hypothetical protein
LVQNLPIKGEAPHSKTLPPKKKKKKKKKERLPANSSGRGNWE